MSIRTAIIEDNEMIRKTLMLVLQTEHDIECIGAYANAEQALADLPGVQPPHVLLVDLALPGMSGLDCVHRVMGWTLRPQVVMLTGSDDEDSILKCIASGACGYLLKPVHAHQIVSAVREAASGGSPMSAGVTKSMVSFLQKQRCNPDVAKLRPLPELSCQENRILQQIVQGSLYKEIADSLGISESTVRTHVQRIYHKLNVHSRSQAVAKVMGIHN